MSSLAVLDYSPILVCLWLLCVSNWKFGQFLSWNFSHDFFIRLSNRELVSAYVFQIGSFRLFLAYEIWCHLLLCWIIILFMFVVIVCLWLLCVSNWQSEYFSYDFSLQLYLLGSQIGG